MNECFITPSPSLNSFSIFYHLTLIHLIAHDTVHKHGDHHSEMATTTTTVRSI